MPDVIEAGAPNILGDITETGAEQMPLFDDANAVVTGAFTYTTKTSNVKTAGTVSSNNRINSLSFNAQLSDSVYGNSDTIQPPAIVLIPQIKY